MALHCHLQVQPRAFYFQNMFMSDFKASTHAVHQVLIVLPDGVLQIVQGFQVPNQVIKGLLFFHLVGLLDPLEIFDLQLVVQVHTFARVGRRTIRQILIELFQIRQI